MKDINKIITESIFVDSYKILREYIDRRGDDVQDVNLILISKYLTDLTENQVKKFYCKYIETGLVYSLPEFYASDLVAIPKGVADIREYRFFTTFGLILYNALGIFFAETCSNMIDNLSLESRGIYSYTPTKYYLFNNEWRINNKWQQEYNKYKIKISEKTNEADVVLSLDISNFFKTIKHEKLIEVISDFIGAQVKEKYTYDGNSEDILSFYFLSMMGDSEGLPQGKKNFASDYLAYLYMTKFDMELETLVASKALRFVSVVRYVDDIHIFLKNTNNIKNKSVYRELSKIEHTISKWLYKNLGLSINDKKTLRAIIVEKAQKDNFINKTQKRTSRSPESADNQLAVDEKVKSFIEAVETFQYPDHVEFIDGLDNSKREDLKYIFEPSVKNKLLSKSGIGSVSKALNNIDFELSATQFNIFGALFGIGHKQTKPFIPSLTNYLRANFDPRDKRHIHIMLLSSAIVLDTAILKSLVKKNNKELLQDDYGKYLSLYYFPNQAGDFSSNNSWLVAERVYNRICLEKKNQSKNFPYIPKNISHGFKPILFLEIEENKKLDSIYTASSGYVHEFTNERWSVAFNKLQMVVHESVKYLFNTKDIDKGADIVKTLIKGGLSISTYEERDFLRFWERRNFNPVSHASKNGFTSPEITKKELIKWEKKVSRLLDKIYQLK